MYQELLADANFYRLLGTIDDDIAEKCRARGCRICGGTLHWARFPRKARGRPPGDAPDLRNSFCCAREPCRKRTTPASVRFLGRKVYLASIVTLVSALREGLTDRRLARLGQTLGVDRRTVQRWRQWWLTSFTTTPFWRAAQALLSPPADASRLPGSLLERFTGEDEAQRLIAFLRFLGPVTGGVSMSQVF